jgi:hypothetical protein
MARPVGNENELLAGYPEEQKAFTSAKWRMKASNRSSSTQAELAGPILLFDGEVPQHMLERTRAIKPIS